MVARRKVGRCASSREHRIDADADIARFLDTDRIDWRLVKAPTVVIDRDA